MLTVKELTYKDILQKVSFQLPETGLFTLIGKNGSGKTTLLKCLLQLLKPTSGEVTFHQFNFLTASSLEIKKKIAYVPTLPTLHFSYTVQEIILMGRFGLQPSLNLSEVLAKCDLDHLKEREVTKLSSGEKQRVYLARALAMRTPILFLDEITAFLDWNQKIRLIHLLKALKKEILVLAASHDLELARNADAIFHLNQGEIFVEPDPESFLQKFSQPLGS